MEKNSCTFQAIDPDDLLGESGDNYPSVQNYDLYNQSLHPDFSDYEKPPKKNSFCIDDDPPTISANTNTNSKLSQSSQEQRKNVPQTLTNRTSSDSDHIPSEQQLAHFNQSLYSDRIGISPSSSSLSSRKNEEEISIQESYYMKPVVDPVVESPKKRQKPVQARQELQVIFRVTSYFLERGSVSVQVDKELLQDLYDEFFRRELFIPLFNLNLHEEWTMSGEKNLYDPFFQPHRLFRVYLTRYARYVNDKFPAAFAEILPSILNMQQGRSRKRQQATSTIASIFSFDWTSLLQTIKQFVGASKTRMLRKTLLAKAKSIRQAINICEITSLKKDADVLLESQERIWQDLGEVELLLSLQSTEEYCTRKIENSSEPKFKQIWVKYRDNIRQDKKYHLQANLARLPI